MDFVHDQLVNGQPFRVLTVVDNWSRESPVLEVGFRLTGSSVVEALNQIGKTVCLSFFEVLRPMFEFIRSKSR
jgi:putative transposase